MIFALSFDLGGVVRLAHSKNESTHSREVSLSRFIDFCEGLVCEETGDPAFFGVTEGVLLSEEAHARGYETESWVLDEGIAPHERDWLSQEKNLQMVAYFKDEKSGLQSLNWFLEEYIFEKKPVLKAEVEQDWNAKWKEFFIGIIVDEQLKVLPPWSEELAAARARGNLEGIVAINPGAGFGTGTHETTQLCLKLLKSLGSLQGKTILDFGSGSGIVGIVAALQGAHKVYCVEIDPMANDNARENADLNGVSDKIQFLEYIPEEIKNGKVDVLVANILRPILLRFAPVLKNCLKREDSELVLSGLIETDLPEVIRCYEECGTLTLKNQVSQNEWRALWFRCEKK